MSTLVADVPTPPSPASSATLLDALRARRAAIYSCGHVDTETGSTLPAWPVGLDAARGEALRTIVRREGARTCIETGFAYAMSASFILEAMLESCDAPKLLSIDPFQTANWRGAGRRHLREAGVEGFHELAEDRSELELPRLVAAGRRFDAAFIDGDHRFEHVMIDIFYARRLVGAGNLIIVDDAWMPSVLKACAFFTSARLCTVETAPDVPASGKFVLLRVLSEGDARAWDHFAEF